MVQYDSIRSNGPMFQSGPIWSNTFQWWFGEVQYGSMVVTGGPILSHCLMVQGGPVWSYDPQWTSGPNGSILFDGPMVV